MRLFEHPDFRVFITIVANQRGVNEAWVEKDYYLAEVLRVVADTYPDATMLKGGTSLSKGWQLLDRISEDIDLFLDREALAASAGKAISDKALDSHFRKLKDAIAAHPALTHERVETIGGFGRVDRFQYGQSFRPEPFTIAPAVLVEAGIQSGREPAERRTISSLLAEHIRAQGQDGIATDTTSFEMNVLHFRRTFVEKLFAIHGKVVRFRQSGERLQRGARHYADLYVLAGQDEVRTMLQSSEYEAIRSDYDAKSKQFFPNTYRPPDGMRFNSSIALFPDAKLRQELLADYDRDVAPLFFGGQFPPFDNVLGRFEEIRDLL